MHSIVKTISLFTLFSYLTFIFGLECSIHHCASSNTIEIEVFGLSFGGSCLCSLKSKNKDKSNCCQDQKIEIAPDNNVYVKNNFSFVKKNFQNDTAILRYNLKKANLINYESNDGYNSLRLFANSPRKKLYLYNETLLI